MTTTVKPSISDEAVLAYLRAETYGDLDERDLTLEHFSTRSITAARRGLAAALGTLLADLGIAIVGTGPEGHHDLAFDRHDPAAGGPEGQYVPACWAQRAAEQGLTAEEMAQLMVDVAQLNEDAETDAHARAEIEDAEVRS